MNRIAVSGLALLATLGLDGCVMGDTVGTGYRPIAAVPAEVCIDTALRAMPAITVEKRFDSSWGPKAERTHHLVWLYRLAGRRASVSFLTTPTGISYNNSHWSRHPIPDDERAFLLPQLRNIDLALERACGLPPAPPERTS